MCNTLYLSHFTLHVLRLRVNRPQASAFQDQHKRCSKRHCRCVLQLELFREYKNKERKRAEKTLP